MANRRGCGRGAGGATSRHQPEGQNARQSYSRCRTCGTLVRCAACENLRWRRYHARGVRTGRASGTRFGAGRGRGTGPRHRQRRRRQSLHDAAGCGSVGKTNRPGQPSGFRRAGRQLRWRGRRAGGHGDGGGHARGRVPAVARHHRAGDSRRGSRRLVPHQLSRQPCRARAACRRTYWRSAAWIPAARWKTTCANLVSIPMRCAPGRGNAVGGEHRCVSRIAHRAGSGAGWGGDSCRRGEWNSRIAAVARGPGGGRVQPFGRDTATLSAATLPLHWRNWRTGWTSIGRHWKPRATAWSAHFA